MRIMEEKLLFGEAMAVPSSRKKVGRKPSPVLLNGNGFDRRTKRIAFGWYGGKFSHLDWLLPLLPKCHHYCEPFAGSAAVLLNRQPSPVETYNDIDGEIVNFFRVLRDQPADLTRRITLTPLSRDEFYRELSGENVANDLERARGFFVR